MRAQPKLAAAGICLLCLLALRLEAQNDPFVGGFDGDVDGQPHRLLVFSDSPGNYDGEWLAENKRVPLVARRHGEYMIGTIGFPDDSFGFRARVMGALLLIERNTGPPLRFFRSAD